NSCSASGLSILGTSVTIRDLNVAIRRSLSNAFKTLDGFLLFAAKTKGKILLRDPMK
ncbi:hypothetical protein L914_20521, partial [Phytophthora nicotianae]